MGTAEGYSATMPPSCCRRHGIRVFVPFEHRYGHRGLWLAAQEGAGCRRLFSTTEWFPQHQSAQPDPSASPKCAELGGDSVKGPTHTRHRDMRVEGRGEVRWDSPTAARAGPELNSGGTFRDVVAGCGLNQNQDAHALLEAMGDWLVLRGAVHTARTHLGRKGRHLGLLWTCCRRRGENI